MFDDFMLTLTEEHEKRIQADQERAEERRQTRILRAQQKRAQQKLLDGKESPPVINLAKALNVAKENLVALPSEEVNKKVDPVRFCKILKEIGGATGGRKSMYAKRIAHQMATLEGYIKHNPQEGAKQMVVNPSVGTPENVTEDTDEDTDKFQPEQVSKGALEEMVKSLRKDTDDDTVNVATPEETSDDDPEETSDDDTERFLVEALAETHKEFAKYKTAKQTGVE